MADCLDDSLTTFAGSLLLDSDLLPDRHHIDAVNWYFSSVWRPGANFCAGASPHTKSWQRHLVSALRVKPECWTNQTKWEGDLRIVRSVRSLGSRQ